MFPGSWPLMQGTEITSYTNYKSNREILQRQAVVKERKMHSQDLHNHRNEATQVPTFLFKKKTQKSLVAKGCTTSVSLF